MRRSINSFYRQLKKADLGWDSDVFDFAIRRPYEEWMEQGVEAIGGRVNSVICHAFALGSFRKLAERRDFQVYLKDRVVRPGIIELPTELTGVVPFNDDTDRERAVRVDASTAGIGNLAIKGDKSLREIDRLTHNGILILGAMAAAENMTDLAAAGYSWRGKYRVIGANLFGGEHQERVVYDYRQFGPLPEGVV